MSSIVAAVLTLLGVGSLAGLLSLIWHIFGTKAVTAATTAAPKAVDAGFAALEKIPEVAKSATLLSVLQHLDVLSDDLVINEINSAAAVINKDGFTKQTLADLPGSLFSTFKAMLPTAEQVFLASNPSAAAPVLAKLQASVTTAAAAMKSVKLATGVVVKLPTGTALPAGSELVASA